MSAVIVVYNAITVVLESDQAPQEIVADIVGRLCMNLRADGDPLDLFRDVEGQLVLVAEELSPSLIAQLDFHRIAAFVTDAGSWTYHTAILARSTGAPGWRWPASGRWST